MTKNIDYFFVLYEIIFTQWSGSGYKSAEYNSKGFPHSYFHSQTDSHY